ncbi:neuropilin and tolloid-like isoform X2 [Haematobia irritans]|uniref:neuropilin and tolloid-like isoform X2 n=1 Tax=Haematobia irritans TaxID=7368 RepID=UPI003F4F8882
MKLCSSASCGCCFCCYCRSWLMMLLMVSSAIHVSPEMMTTTTTITTTHTNLNNYNKAMTKSSKFNTKLNSRPSTMATASTDRASQPNGSSGETSRQQEYTPAQKLDMKTTSTTQQNPLPARDYMTMTTTTLPSPKSNAIPSQSGHETSSNWPTEKRQRFGQQQIHRSSMDTYSYNPMPTSDNYDAVIRTTDRTDFFYEFRDRKSVGTGTRHVQITIHNSDINNESRNLKYPRIESNASEHHATGATEASTKSSTTARQHIKRASSTPEGAHAVHGLNQTPNNGETVRNTITGLGITATAVPSKTKPNSTSNSNAITSNNNTTGNVIQDLTSSTADNSHSLAHVTEENVQLQRIHTDLEYNQLKRPLLAESTHWLHRHARQVEEEPVDKCRLFEVGDPEKMELYSPDYPNVYPKNINCTRVITAQKGQIIRLDFRNSFHIEEKEDCKFDFLEIRDGQYGFSNLIGKFCGTDFPPEITSKERYLWLHFHSDESIEYTGFTAVYEFIDRTRDAPSTDLNCTIEKHGDEGFVNSTDIPTEIREIIAANKIALDCMWRIQVQEKWKIQVKFIDFKLSKPNDCDVNFLDIFPEQTVMPLRVKNFCGSAGEGITSESNILHMRFYAEQQAVNSTFAILYTAFRDRGSGSCTEDEYDCEDATCIAANLKCNQRDNCKFRWDEEGCEPEAKGQSEHMTIIITVFGLILGGMVITFLVNCVRKIMHDQKIIRDVPVLSDGIYHIDSFILDAPKPAIFVGLQDDYALRCSPGREPSSGHENTMAVEINDDDSSSSSFVDDHSYSDASQMEANSIKCCTAYSVDDTLSSPNPAGGHDGVIHFNNDEFIIVPQVPQNLITSHCNIHSSLARTSPTSSEQSCNNSAQMPGTDSSEEDNYCPSATSLSLAIYPEATPRSPNQSFMQKCAQ